MSIELPTIAILGGTGKEGSGLALRWAAAGYSIIIGSRQKEKAEAAANLINMQLGISTSIGLDNKEAARRADICVLTVIPAAHTEILRSLKRALQGKTLVDATSRVDYRDPKPPASPSAAEEAQEILGSNVRVVAAFQNVPARKLSQEINKPLDADVLVCSNEMQSADSVVKLARAAGLRGYYAGTLTNAIVVESLTSILISINKHYHVKDASLRISGIEE